MYTGETILTFGKYKHSALKLVPEQYLLNVYNNHTEIKEPQITLLRKYIEENIIKNQPSKEKESPIVLIKEPIWICDKCLKKTFV